MGFKLPAQIIAEVERVWNRGHLLVPAPELVFPWEIPIAAPDSKSMRDEFQEILAWYQALEAHEAAIGRPGYRIRWREVRFLDLGRNRAPEAAVIESLADALALIDRTKDAARFQALLTTTDALCPALLGWMRQRPLVVVEQEAVWERVVAVVRWFQDNQRPGIYRRQIPLPGIDTKFIEERKAFIARLLDAVHPTVWCDPTCQPSDFDSRYGLRPKPVMISIRSLDPAISFGGLSEVVAPLAQLAVLRPDVYQVIVVENEITGLSIPLLPRSIVIHGLGYGVDVVAELPWVKERTVRYWGDIDTHGFAILSRLRGSLPQVQSFLMDEATLMRHRWQWVTEKKQDLGRHRYLQPAEETLLQQLRAQTFGSNVRLEQERISWEWALANIGRFDL